MEYAQKLNNIAALLIDVGHYDRAILSLQRALRLSELYAMGDNDTNRAHCKCHECTLDGCIAFSEQQKNTSTTPTIIIKNESSNSTRSHTDTNNSINKRRRIMARKSPMTNEDCDRDDNKNANYKHKPSHNGHGIDESPAGSNNNDSGYIYRHPILIQQGHKMGSIRFLVILFNLALAQHLKALSSSEDKKEHPTKKALLLYELIFEYWSRLQGRSSKEDAPCRANNIRFVMIIYNNLSQMYRLVNNSTKQKQCLQHLLSTVMVVIDNKARNVHTSFTPVTSQNSNSDCDDAAFRNSLDGFLTNTATLMLQEQCAQAA